MRRIIISLLYCITFCATALAKPDDAVSMVSYEQSWLDSKGTLALKNNTEEYIENVSFVIKYLDMKGNPLDYEEFSYYIDIAPGMTKKLDIPAYEHDRNYHYYKTKDETGYPAFKIEYKLKGYNLPDDKITEDNYEGNYDKKNDKKLDEEYDEEYDRRPFIVEDNSPFPGSYTIIIFVAIALFAIGISVGLYVIVAVMAMHRHRNPVIWLLLSFIASPLLVIVILLCIGDSGDDDFISTERTNRMM